MWASTAPAPRRRDRDCTRSPPSTSPERGPAPRPTRATSGPTSRAILLRDLAGLEYLFGHCYREASGEVVCTRRRGKDRDGEREVFERFVDWLAERRRRYPRMHVYHYAAYERTALTRLMGEHGTREEEVDGFLRGEVLVDLYRIVKQSLRARWRATPSRPSRSYEFEHRRRLRRRRVGGALRGVARDGRRRRPRRRRRATTRQHRLLDGRAARVASSRCDRAMCPGAFSRGAPAERGGGGAGRRAGGAGGRAAEGAEEGSPGACSAISPTTTSEARLQWWAWFRWPQLDDDELIADRTAIGGLVHDGNPPVVEGQSHAYRMSFPPQEHKLSVEGVRPDTRARFRLRVDDDSGTVKPCAGRGARRSRCPAGWTPGGPVRDAVGARR